MKTIASVLVLSLCAWTAAAEAASWTPDKWAGEDTIEIRTTAPGEQPHWFPVWLVVLDGQVYVRLGSRASERIASNQTAPYVGIRIAGEASIASRLRPQTATAAVAEGMGKKYWSDLWVRYFSHPLTLRLVAPPAPGSAPAAES